MQRWRYNLTVHTADDILEHLSRAVDEVPPTIYCSDTGACYFDAGPNPFTEAIQLLLSQQGEEGWELVQVIFRPNQLIAFWKQPLPNQ